MISSATGAQVTGARSVLRRLLELQGTALPEPVQLPGRHGVTLEVFPDDPGHQRLPGNDPEIIDRALHIGELTGRNVLLAAGGYRMPCRAAGAALSRALMPRSGQEGPGLGLMS